MEATVKDENFVEVKNFIDNSFLPYDNHVDISEPVDIFEPGTGAVYGRCPNTDASVVDRAVKAAKEAFLQWSATPVTERSRIMLKIAQMLEDRLPEFAELESRDQGKPVLLAKHVDIPRAVHNFRFFANAILHWTHSSSVIHYKVADQNHSAVNYVAPTPIGVAALISPWNLPMYLLTFKIAPAIAAGNTVVCKPSELTPVTAYKFCSILRDAGLPKGVVNMVFGEGAKTGQALVEHRDVAVLSFTGGTETAKKIKQARSSLPGKMSLELGGKNPAVVFADCNLERRLPDLIRSCFTNQGEICLCSSRIFVENAVFEKFVKKFVGLAKGYKVGDRTNPNTKMGALISRQHLQKVTSYGDIALKAHQDQKSPVKIHCGYGVEKLNLPDELKKGYYFPATVVTGVSDDSRLMTEEIFGPIVCIVPFHTEAEVIQRVNNSRYALSATLWTEDAGRIHRVAQQIQAGTVWCNCWMPRDLNMPFGGYKDSGIGREGYPDSLQFFTEAKTICVQFDQVAHL